MTSVPPPFPAQPPQPWQKETREGRSVSFYVAIFLLLLLLISGALNVLLFFVGVIGSAASATLGAGAVAEDDGSWQLVTVGGDTNAKAAILRIRIEGAIAEGVSPLIGARGGTVSLVRRALRAATREKDTIKAVLLEINSPGGGVTDSDEIHRLITSFKKERGIPVHALFGDLSASGGYYVAAACDKIIARPTSMTGSIGVIISTFNVAEAAKKVGVEQVTIVSRHTPYKDMLSPMKATSENDRRVLTSIVEEMYERFVDIVAAGRPKLTRDDVRRIADGRIYSALQAKELGLVDAVEHEDAAIAALTSAIGVSSAQIIEHRRRPTLAELLIGARAPAPSLEASLAHLLGATSGPRLLYLWQGGR